MRKCACLIEKPDEPARSRHCKGSKPALCHWEGYPLGKAQGRDEPSQENCLFEHPPRAEGTDLRVTGRGFMTDADHGLSCSCRKAFIYIFWEEFG